MRAMMTSRRCFVACLATALPLVAAQEAWCQYGVTQSLPASAVMMSGGSDGWHSRGGVVGPWWSGGATGAMPPAADGGFWFGTPGLGFGASQGSTRGMNTFTPSVTTTSGGAGTMASTRLIPLVTGVVPVVGSGSSVTPVTTAAVLPPPHQIPSVIQNRSSGLFAPPGAAPRPSGLDHASTPGARERAKLLVSAGDRRLVDGAERVTAARAALGEYRSAMRFVRDDPTIEIRQAILWEALGKRRDADRAIARAERIDGRLARPLGPEPQDAGGFLGAPPAGRPAFVARGFLILDEITALAPPAESPNPESGRPAIVEWLGDAWASRWGARDGSAMLEEP